MEESSKLTVVIADDEYYICQLLKRIILWDELNLDLIAVVSNGKELLHVIMDERPDIVITDICMPEMDGLELIQQTRKLKIPCKFIIVSGYRQFEYAYNALKYDVEDYILKPINDEELNSVLRKIVQQLAHSTQISRNEDLLLVQSSQEQIRRLFFTRILREGVESGLTLEEIRENYGLHFQPGLFRVMCLKLDITDQPKDIIEDVNSLNKKLADLSSDILGNHCHEILIDMDSLSIRVGINYDLGKDEKLKNKIQEYFNHVKHVVDLFKGLKITIGVGEAYQEIGRLKDSETQAIGAVLFRVVQGTDQIIYWDQLAQSQGMLSAQERKEFLEKVAKAYEILDHHSFSQLVNHLFLTASTKFSGYELFELVRQLIELYFETQQEMIAKFQSGDYLRKHIFYGVQNATSLMKMERAIVEPIVESMQEIAHEVAKQNVRPVRQVIEYIENNYDRPIKLADVAAEVLLNPVYLSNMFKKETGENFSDFLTEHRMKMAKDKLQNSELNINEIAHSVGYSNARHFSRMFKKVVGIRPTEYRKIYG